MKARFENVRAELDAERRRLELRFTVENRSPQTWSPEEVFLGWQLFDPASGLFIAEGEWRELPAEVPPGERAAFELTLELHPERGRYHVYVSLLGRDDGWFYVRGGEFLLVECTVAEGRAALVECQPATLARLRRRRLGRALVRAFTYPFRTMLANRSLIRSMVRRDIASRYRGSIGDAAWTVLNPLLLMATYFFVFGIVLRTRFGGDPSRAGFALYFLAGMLPWLPFSEAAGRAPGIVMEYRNFVKKLVFPIEILPVNLAIAGLVTQAFALAVFAVFLLASRGAIPLTALWLPALIVPQFLFTLGVSWLLAAAGVFVRDLGQVIGYLLTLWFFLTPICYPEASLPAAAAPLLSHNPVYILVSGFRACLLEGTAPAAGPTVELWLVAAAAFILGHAFFYRLRRSFADVL